MTERSRSRGGRHAASAVLTLAVALAPMAAAAQAPSPGARIDAIERQIRSMERELRQLKGELRHSRREAARAKAEARQAHEAAARASASERQATAAAARAQAVAAAHPAAPAKKQGRVAANGFGIESADGRNSIYLTGRLHFDAGQYIDYSPASKFAKVQNLNSGVNARRARIGVKGVFARDWAYALIADFGGTTDSGGASLIENAYITYNGLKRKAFPVAFDLGYMDTPFTLQEAMSSNNILFVERASIQTVASGIFAGDNRSAFGVRSNNDRYWAGIYLTGPTSGASHTTGEQYGAFGRATYQLVSAPDYSVHIGADVGGLLKPPGAPRSITLGDRPELRVDPTTILTTGALGTAAHPVNDAAVYGVEGAVAWRNLLVQGEYYHIDVDRRGLRGNGFDGGYVEAAWTITGEHHKYGAGSGAYGGITPERPFEPWAGNYGRGAWELAFRYSTIDLNSNFHPFVVPGPLSNAVGGGNQTVYAAGLNWYPNAHMRFMFDYLHANINKRFSVAADGGIAGTPLGARVGGDMDAVVLRSQFAF